MSGRLFPLHILSRQAIPHGPRNLPFGFVAQ